MDRLVQHFQASKKHEFMELEKQFVALERQGILPKGERMSSLSSREPGNTLIWQARFGSLQAAEEALEILETSSEHTVLYDQQKHYFEDTWVEFFATLDD